MENHTQQPRLLYSGAACRAGRFTRSQRSPTTVRGSLEESLSARTDVLSDWTVRVCGKTLIAGDTRFTKTDLWHFAHKHIHTYTHIHSHIHTHTLRHTHTGPSLWNTLPVHLKNRNLTLTTFMRHLKSYLFSQYWFRIERVWGVIT